MSNPQLAECALCYHITLCVDDGEALICVDRVKCLKSQKKRETAMQCEGFKPGCTNVAIHCVNGYNFCTPCAQEFCGYTPVLTPLARARQLFSESAIPIDRLASEVLVGLVAEAFRAVQQEERKSAVRHIYRAMEDVESPRTPGVQSSSHVSIDDVRRLADELLLDE